jgi:hypothetical protein
MDHTMYGETVLDSEARNLRQRAYRVFDHAGVVSSEKCDFNSNTYGCSAVTKR